MQVHVGAGAKVLGHPRARLAVHERPMRVVHDEQGLVAELAQHDAELVGRSAGSLTVIVSAERLAGLVPRLFAVLDVKDLSVERQPLEHLIREIYRRGIDAAGSGEG